MSQSREKNSNWRGGRTLASNGYMLIRVGVGHPLADVRGYAYEHRLVAMEMLGRPLDRSEHVHHRNGNRTDNRVENLEVVSIQEHARLHGQPRVLSRWREIVCSACGKTALRRIIDLEHTKHYAFCNLTCQRQWERVTAPKPRDCEVCGRRFTPWRGNIGRCCSRKCSSVLGLRARYGS